MRSSTPDTLQAPLRFAVAGCGSIGMRHLAILRAEPRAVIAAICDVDPARLDMVPDDGARRYASYAELLRDGAIDVVSICTPHAMHAAMAVQAIETGRHVLVEKPMALSGADARTMIRAAAARGVKLCVVKQNRYNVPVVLTRRALEEGWLGRVLMVQCNVLWNRDDRYYAQSPWRGRLAVEGGALYTQASHFIDLLTWWFGGVVQAQGLMATRNHDIEIEDCGTASLLFESGVVGSLTWTTCVYRHNYEGSITILGERGTIKIGGKYLNTIEYWDVADHPLPADMDCSDKPNLYDGYVGSSSNHDRVFQETIAAILGERHDAVDGPGGIKSIEAMELIYASMAGAVGRAKTAAGLGA